MYDASIVDNNFLNKHARAQSEVYIKLIDSIFSSNVSPKVEYHLSTFRILFKFCKLV